MAAYLERFTEHRGAYCVAKCRVFNVAQCGTYIYPWALNN
jgi:hypothetical protein